MKVLFVIPKIQAKERPRASRQGHIYTPMRTRAYEQDVAFQYLSEKKEFFEGPVRVQLLFQIHKPKTVKRNYPTVVPDIDNLIKSVFDGLNGAAWKDDSQVVRVEAEKIYTDGEDSVTVIIEDICSRGVKK